MKTLEQLIAGIREWNELAQCPYDPENEKEMLLEEQLEEIDALGDQWFVLQGTMYKMYQLENTGVKIIKEQARAKHCYNRLLGVVKGLYYPATEQKNLEIANAHLEEILKANNEKLIPTPQGVHTEIKGNNKLKIGKPKGWTPPNHRAVYDKYFKG